MTEHFCYAKDLTRSIYKVDSVNNATLRHNAHLYKPLDTSLTPFAQYDKNGKSNKSKYYKYMTRKKQVQQEQIIIERPQNHQP